MVVTICKVYLSGRDIIRIIVASKSHLPYTWPKGYQVVNVHSMDHLTLELLLYIDVLGYVKETPRVALFS